MSMPPSGVEGLMDEQSVIEAEIQLELENINLEDEVQLEDDLNGDVGMQQDFEGQDGQLEDELDCYIKRLQDQSNRFEQELLECDELLSYSSNKTDTAGTALIPYDDQTLLMQLAKEQGCDVEEYKRKILDDIENDEVIIEDELADLIDDTSAGSDRNGEQCSITWTGETGAGVDIDARLPVKIEKAVEEGIDYDEVPVSQELVLVNGEREKQANIHKDIQKMLKDQLESLEHRYQERMDKIKKDEAYRRDEEEVRERRVNEERQWKLQEIHREEQQLIVEREMAEKEIQREQELAEKEMQENMKKFQEEMAQLQADVEQQKKEHEMMVQTERQRQEEKQNKAALAIQRTYRGYKVRKETQSFLMEKKETRKKEKEEQRIKELEIEIEKRKEEQLQQEELERQKQEEEKRQKEELKRQKEEEKKRLEEEKRRRKEEEERIKQEEKRKKEEEKQRKKGEEKKRKEEEKRRKEEEEQRKKEEKRLKEEEEKRRKEDEKRQKEEEKRRKEEEKRLKEEEKKREKERQLEEEQKKKKEEIKLKEEMSNKENMEKDMEQTECGEDKTLVQSSADKKFEQVTENTGNVVEMPVTVNKNHTDKHLEPNTTSCKTEEIRSDEFAKKNKEIIDNIASDKERAQSNSVDKVSDNSEVKVPLNVGTDRPKTPRSSGTIKTPRPPTPRKENKDLKKMEKKEEEHSEKKVTKVDILPDHLEALRLKFIKECQPWSKVSNEPWKLKAGVSRKPLRRPSSAKKLPLISEDVIIQAARVASLKMVTTVELKDLPGSNMSTLGQCGGLKYLTLNKCNLVAIEGLGQCKQLQYIDVQDNKIEYVDLKDAGQLQYLNLSHNKLSSIHGLDNCTNLRWLDLSFNNVTRLGGMDTMRRLHTLKLSHNQLISTQGLGVTPTLQMLDVSHNHLQAVEDLDKLCLLFSLNVTSNNLLQVPSLHNQVLLLELLLADNSISSLSSLAAIWFPLLNTVHMQQNSLSELPSLQNCLLLKELNLSENQIQDPGSVQHCVEACFYLEQLHLQENPVYTDLTESFFTKLKGSCPRLNNTPDCDISMAFKLSPVKPRNSFETMCLTQIRGMKDAIIQFEHNLKLMKESPLDQCQVCDLHYKFCDRTFNIAVEHRYAHEYGDISVAMPTAPTGPKSGRPLSSRQREKFMNPKEMFENALKSNNSEPCSGNTTNGKEFVSSNPKDLFENALKSQTGGKQNADSVNNVKEVAIENNTSIGQLGHFENPKDLFEQALKSSERPSHVTDRDRLDGKDNLISSQVLATDDKHKRDLHSHHNRSGETEKVQAATVIQAAWRGYFCRKQLSGQLQNEKMINIDPAFLEKLNKSAVIIQASWRGYSLRKKLLAALEYAQCDFDEDDDVDAMDFGDEFDLDKFVDIDQDLLDTDWKPPDTPDIPPIYPVLKKPPSGKPRVPPINTADLRPPSNPRRAWRNAESPLSDLGKIPRPPSSVASTELTVRSGVSKKEEKMAEEWGFKDSGTAHLMMQRAKKMKYNAERRKKISKLDPKQRLALFRKLEEVIHPPTHTVPQRKTLPRKEYFQARQDEIVRQEHEKRQEYHTRASRTFEWLHTQVGDHAVSDSVINQGHSDGPKYVHMTENNLPELLNGGKRVQLISSPMSVELQSVESASTVGQKPRRFSAGSGASSSKLPPIQPSSAPATAPHLKERMSFRNPKVNQSVGWGGGKKRGKPF